MDYSQETKSGVQTFLHTLAAAILFIPLVFIAGAALIISDFLSAILSGNADGISFIARGIQYGAAAAGSLALPGILLKRSNSVVAASVWCSIVCTLYFLTIIFSASFGRASNFSFFEWLQVAASFIGIIVGTVGYAQDAFRN